MSAIFIQSKKKGNHKTNMTIFSIPESFVHIETTKIQKVTPEMEEFFKQQFEYDNLVDALLTAIFHYVHSDGKAIGIEGLEKKVEEVLQLLRETDIQSQESNYTEEAKMNLAAELDDLLSEFGG